MDIFNKKKIKKLELYIEHLEEFLEQEEYQEDVLVKEAILKELEKCWPTLTQQEIKNLLNNL